MKRDILFRGLLLGLSQLNACRYARIGETTLYDWLERGRAGQKGYKEFVEEFEHTLAKVQAEPLKMLHSLMPTSVAACLEFLARKFPEEWGRRDPDVMAAMTQRPQTNVLVIEVGAQPLQPEVLNALPPSLARFLAEPAPSGNGHDNGTPTK